MELDIGSQFVGIFLKMTYDLPAVLIHANAMDKKYTELRELTCPQDED